MMAGNNTVLRALTVALLMSPCLVSAAALQSSISRTEDHTSATRLVEEGSPEAKESPSASNLMAQQKILHRAEACTRIQSRLNRLTCFDEVFNTPVIEQVRKQAKEGALPAAWHRALKNEKHRTGETGFLLNMPAGKGSAFFSGQSSRQGNADFPPYLWATAPALGVLPPRPVLMFSCIDKISRAELILPDALEGSRLYLQLRGKRKLKQRWLSDESGLVLRSGRGIPAIQAMKTALSGQQLVLVSQDGSLKELMFDTQGLNDVLKPMREVCRW